MLAIARALIARPRLLVVDEVTSGLAPKLVAQVFAALAELPARGITLLVAEQNARRALQIADQALVLQRGEAALAGPAAELRGDTRLLDAYLGSQ
jgi:branched-chain amino acid transport system ATP-binding protein